MDPYQLPPVKEKESEVFHDVKTVINLDTVIRQKEGNPLLHVFNLLRNDIDNNTSTALEYISNNRNNIVNGVGYKMVFMDEYKELIQDYFKHDAFYKNINYVRGTGYTNMMVGNWNNLVRESIFETNNKGIIIEDLITSYKTLVDENMNPIIVNSDDYILEDIREYRNEYRLDVNCVILKSATTGRLTPMIQVLNHKDPDNVQHYINIITKIREGIMASNKSGKWFPYYKFKNQILSMIDVDIQGKYDAKPIPLSREIDYGYNLTVHKLQGSTFENIFVDGKDICKPMTRWGKERPTEINLRNRLLYVALSRAKNIAYIRF